ncbi:MAG: alpha/beta hydrolase [Paenibacillus dendritiformis]|uniref:alpha/beta fold hydrolase n=1 Tax=Paenibacillus dendritiformis TaxID=130049 RepID=UPI00143DD89E|nr:alpha/beta hydrolase [Paenibacillus dendritiformis]MDU5144372.1 alpha/beta hydrolase [Paenibacillus dendritiformis]NKI20528.1 alpha/beta hydrolase [Paenibacillus dendritiformis]NRF98785.1 alpha/beta hydrolase [Paenibacillus dendritiformis]
MPYIPLHPIKQFDFQINRILTYGDEACSFDEIKGAVPQIVDLDSWYRAWLRLGEQAEADNRKLHAAYYYRLAEFFLKKGPEKQKMYEKSLHNFRSVMDRDERLRVEYVPYEHSSMKTFIFETENPLGNMVVFGGYDSFIEEFYLAIQDLAKSGYTIYLFEGPGQGESLKKGLAFEPHWEKPVSALLDYFKLEDVCLIGVSWGGYLALRAAAFERRIAKTVAYDVLYDGFDCMINPFPAAMQTVIKLMFRMRSKSLINFVLRQAMKKQLILDWAISHGQYITGTDSPYHFYMDLKRHTLRGITSKIKCDVLLLAGERDHYIPSTHYHLLMNRLTNANTVTGRMFTEEEGGAEHCQIGNHGLAIKAILDWLK